MATDPAHNIKGADATASVSDTTDTRTVVNVYNIQTVHNLQAGDQNKIVQILQKSLDEQEKSDSGDSCPQKEDILRAMLNSVMNPANSSRPSPVSLAYIQTTFDRLYGKTSEGQKRKFRDLAGLKMLQFMQHYSEWFHVEKRGTQHFIKPLYSQRKPPKKHEDDQRYIQAQLTTFNVDDVPEDEEVYASPHDETAAESKWKVVAKSRQKHCRNSNVSQDANLSKWRPTTKLTSDKCASILNSINRNYIIRKSNAKWYIDNPLMFMWDVVSLWNTPRKHEDAFIVLGIDKDSKLVGIQHHLSDDMFQKLFKDEIVTVRPNFRYEEAQYNGYVLGIISVFNGKGSGQPCIVKSHKIPQCPLKENELYYREKGRNVSCQPQHETYGQIWSWVAPEASDQSKVTKDSMALVNNLNVTKLLESVDNFRKGYYVLITNHCRNTMKNIKAMTLIPWLLVFDFDIQGREIGMYSVCEDIMKKKRPVYTSTWATLPTNLNEQATTWCFVRGLNDQQHTVEDGNSSNWYSQVKSNLRLYCEKIGNFAVDSVVTVIVLWNEGEVLLQHLNRLLFLLDTTLDASRKIVLCTTPFDEKGKEANLFETMEDLFQIILFNSLSPESFFHAILTLLGTEEKDKILKYRLPTCDGLDNPDIDIKDAAWLAEDFHILYVDNPSPSEIDPSQIQVEAEQFLKGALLPWYIRYVDQMDVQRDIMQDMLCQIEKSYIDHCRSGLLTIYHAPGAGGTTFAQRVLWELHRQTPCMELKIQSESSISELITKIDFVYSRTVLGYRPIIIMIDGDDDFKVKQMQKAAMTRGLSVLLIHVKRSNKRMVNVRNNENHFWLKGDIILKEANALNMKFRDRCDNETKKENLLKLVQDVKNGKRHCMYEFGLAAYLHEYKGVSNYVRGYVALDENPTADLLPWQKLLGYLSLVYYYGQASVPCQFFVQLLGKPSNYAMSIDDIPEPAAEFILQDTNEAKSNQIRICHYIVAKEILDYILNRQQMVHPADQRTPHLLSLKARQNLCKFSIQFIEYVGKRTMRASNISEMITHIVTKTFICRDNSEIRDGELSGGRKKPKLSAILYDIPSRPPYSERLMILQKLVESFPSNPSFHAHLGRFYGYYRPEEEEEAENALNKALSLCKKAKPSGGQASDRMNHTLKIIYHMYGMIYKMRIGKYAGWYLGDKPVIKTKKTHIQEEASNEFEENLRYITDQAMIACDHFANCRSHTKQGEEECYGYVGEMDVRLQVCDYVRQNFDGGLSAYIESATDQKIVPFLKKSFAAIYELILECCDAIPDSEMDRSFYNVVFWFNTIFLSPDEALANWQGEDDIQTRRMKIAAMKLKSDVESSKEVKTLDSISSKEDIEQIVTYLEENIEDMEMVEASCGVQYDMDFKEWIHAIRHNLYPKHISVEEVLSRVQHWYDNRKSALSIFYLFVLNSLVGFGVKKQNASNSNLVEADQLRKELVNARYCTMINRIPREWLGKQEEKGIRRLVAASQCRPMVQNKRINSQRNRGLLAACKGTVSPPNNNPRSGYIEMDVKRASLPVRVFFVPLKNKLDGARFASERVEFRLSFTFGNGYEAFDVKKLTRFRCRICSGIVEATSEDNEISCLHCSADYKR